jgi:hypothetical protein
MNYYKSSAIIILILLNCCFAERVNILVNSAVESGWTYSGAGDYHVTASMVGNGRGGVGNALSFTNSIYDSTSCNLNFSTENTMFPDRYIPNNATVYVSGWVKVSSGFVQTAGNSGPEVRLKVVSPYNNAEYWSNTSGGGYMNSLTFGWSNAASIPYNQLTTSWQYFEFPVNVGSSGWAGGWTNIKLNVTDRVGWRGANAAGFNGTIYFDDLKVEVDVNPPVQSPNNVTVGGGNLSLELAQNANYALSSITTSGVTFGSGLKFPTFVVYGSDGVGHIFEPEDSGWVCQTAFGANTAEIIYNRTGLSVKVLYTVASDIINVAVTPISEAGYKVISVRDGGSMACVASNSPDANTAFLLTPTLGGELIRFPAQLQELASNQMQSWDYPATFFSIGYNNKGLLIRCPQFGATWSYGIKSIQGQYALSGGFEGFFRPGGATNFSMPLVDPKIEVQIVPVADKNGDGSFDWVDLGIEYSERFITKNQSLDEGLVDSVSGKIDISGPPSPVNNYATLLSQIQTVAALGKKQVWWLVGAHTAPEKSYCDPVYSTYPDPNVWRGDYFTFRQNAAAANTRIGIHEAPQYINTTLPEWGVPLRLDKDGNPVVTAWNSYCKATNDSSFYPFINQHFINWQVNAGDTWHWDVLTAEVPAENYEPSHLATRGTDFRNRIDVLKYIKNKGIHITSEGLQEGASTYCDMAWMAKVADNTSIGEFPNSEYVPLTPVLFLGKTYYCMGFNVSKSLLYGGKRAWENTSLPSFRDAQMGYYGYTVYYTQIANRTVWDMDRTANGWTVNYMPNGTATINLLNNTFSVITFPYCGQPGTVYLPGDLDNDCYVNFSDLETLASYWLECSDPTDASCDQYWK